VGTPGSGAAAAAAGAGGTAAGAAPQAASVINATVQQVLGENLVQVAIGNLLLDLASDMPLQVGQTVQLAVAHTDQGVRLAIVGLGAGAADPSTRATVVDLAVPLTPTIAPANDPLSPLERIAVSVATEAAATQQGSQAQLFADLNVVANAPGLPPALGAAIAQVLAQQTPLDTTLTGADVQTAFQHSGLLLEASLATGTVASGGNGPDLKAALIVLRQTLASVLQTTDGGTTAPTAPAMTSPYAATAAPYATTAAQAGKTAAQPTQMQAPPLVPEADVAGMPQPGQGRSPLVDGAPLNNPTANALADMLAPSKSLTTGAVLTLLQEAQQQIPRAAGFALPARVLTQDGRGEDVVIRTNTPPPPFRGGQPTAQAIASSLLAPNAPLSAIAHRLLDDTDAALSRQTLLQVASLPDRTDTSGGRIDPSLPRWHFEIPFATPQGTAMAQFEISRDGGGNAPDAAKRVWRARFSLDVEPAGPVHAMITLIGDRTSVRMWAERPATAAQLRADLGDLSQALDRAELSAGDLIVQDGKPPSAAPPRAGHFVDRAL
jgi:hypothetical protein